MKGKKLKFSCKKVEQKVIAEQLSQCLDEETPIVDEVMDIYEGSSKIVKPYDNYEDLDLTDVSSSLDNRDSPGMDGDNMVQCVPELTPPQLTESTVKTKRPKFKVTPKRSDRERFDVKTTKRSNNDKTETEQNPKKKSKNKEGSWVQCSKSDCLKWRKLPEGIEPISIPDRWVCPMNEDPSRMDCAASQETCDSQADYDVVYTQFVAGSIVWAKVPGYPWWPGMVEDDPDYRCCYEIDDTEVNPVSYHVSFIFDKEVSRSWVSCINIKIFAGTPDPNEVYSKFKKSSRPLIEAKELAQNALNMSLQERLARFSFSALYKGVRKTRELNEEIDSSPNDENYQPHSDSSIHFEKEAYFTTSKREGKRVKQSKKVVDSKKRASSSSSTKSHHRDGSSTKSHHTDSSARSHHTDDGGIVKAKKIRKKVLESSEEEGDVENMLFEQPMEGGRKTVEIQETTGMEETSLTMATNDGGHHGVVQETPAEESGSQKIAEESVRLNITENDVGRNTCKEDADKNVSQNIIDGSMVVESEMTTTKKKAKHKRKKSSESSGDGNGESLSEGKITKMEQNNKENDIPKKKAKKAKKNSGCELPEHGSVTKERSDEVLKKPKIPKPKKKRSNEGAFENNPQKVGDDDDMVPKISQNPEVPKPKKKRSKEGGIENNPQQVSDNDMVLKISQNPEIPKPKKKQSNEGGFKNNPQKGGDDDVLPKISQNPEVPKPKKKRSNEGGFEDNPQHSYSDMVPKISKNPEVPKFKRKRSNEGGIGNNAQHSDLVSKISKKLKVMKSKKQAKLGDVTKKKVSVEPLISGRSDEKVVSEETLASPHEENRSTKYERKTTSPKNKDRGSMKRSSTDTSTSTSEVNSTVDGSEQKTARKSGSSGNKKMKPTFKAPVKTGTKRVADVKSSPGNKVENQPEGDECYVSIDTLEKDINSLYKELSDGDHIPTKVIHHEADTSDCITIEFLDDELTVDLTQCRPTQRRNLTDSPEY